MLMQSRKRAFACLVVVSGLGCLLLFSLFLDYTGLLRSRKLQQPESTPVGFILRSADVTTQGLHGYENSNDSWLSSKNVGGVMTSSKDAWPSLRGTSITREEMQARIKELITRSIKENPHCADVHKAPQTFWRSFGSDLFTLKTDFTRMSLAHQCGAFYDENLLSYNPREPPFSFEADILSRHALANMTDVASSELSEVHLLTKSTSLRVGDKIEFKIILKNGRGERVERGADHVRLWLVADESDAAIAADVTDKRNGNYLASTVLAWSGKVKVKVAVSHTTQLYWTQLFLHRFIKIGTWFSGNFIGSHATEATPCGPFPILPFFEKNDVCNLTEQNGQFPWYCGKPAKREYLNCSHYVSTTKLTGQAQFPLTSTEIAAINTWATKRPALIPNAIHLNVSPRNTDKVLPEPSLPCDQRNLSTTFQDSNVSGFFYKGKWRPLACRLPKVNTAFVRKCLVNTHFLMLGDSNSRQQMDVLAKLSGCMHKIDRKKIKWHAPLRCDIDSQNTSILYFPPKNPFYGSENEAVELSALHSEVEKLDSIPDSGRYIVHIHHFLHIVPSHLSLLEHRLRLLRRALVRLLARKSDVTVVYQSAHTAYVRHPRNQFKVNAFVWLLQREILEGLGDRVMFFNSWPLTLAKENVDGHPTIADELAKVYLGHVCPHDS